MARDTTVVREFIDVPQAERGRHYSGPVIDCDVHHNWATESALVEYLEPAWQEYVQMPRGQTRPLGGPNDFLNPHGGGGVRQETYPEVGGSPGSHYETMVAQLLDPFNVRKAVLTYNSGLFGLNRQRNPYLATAVAKAANDWTIDQWLNRDKRFAGSVLIANHLPEEAAKEIRRVGGHPGMGQVVMAGNGIGQPLGHHVFNPIWEAALEMNLPISIHSGGGGATYPPAAGGFISLYLEYHIMMFQPVQTTVLSMITHGLFERYPGLRVLLSEGGVAWVPSFLWRMDADYKGLRREAPWMKRLPSEYFMDHFKLSTQPFELSPKREQMIQICEMFNGEDMLLFATDYPHWDTDDVDYIAGRLPKEWHSRIYFQNAQKFYGWSDEDLGITEPVGGS